MDPSRQARFDPLGVDGQAAIGSATVLVIGVGALGSVAAELLVRGGVRRLRLVDRDVVEASNLHRVALMGPEDAALARAKAPAVADALRRLAPETEIDAVVADVDGTRIRELVAGCDVVLDGTDNFEARHLLNEIALETGTPWVHAACLGAQALAWPLIPGRGPCYACHVPDVPAPGSVDTCETAGILGGAVHAAASMQVVEAFKIVAGRLDELLPGPWSLDLWRGTSAQVAVARDPDCAACARGERRLLDRRRTADWIACGRRAVHLRPPGVGGTFDLARVAARLAGREGLRQNRFLVRFSADGHDVTVFADGRLLVTGTSDVERARALVARHLGG